MHGIAAQRALAGLECRARRHRRLSPPGRRHRQDGGAVGYHGALTGSAQALEVLAQRGEEAVQHLALADVALHLGPRLRAAEGHFPPCRLGAGVPLEVAAQLGRGGDAQGRRVVDLQGQEVGPHHLHPVDLLPVRDQDAAVGVVLAAGQPPHVLPAVVDKANYLIESLCNVVVPAFKLEFANVYDRVKARSPPEFVIRNFQEELERAPDRTVEQGHQMLELIVSVHACPWLAGLLNDIVDEFRSLIGYTGTVAITPEAFLNNCYRNIARDLWKRPYLLFDKFDRYECCKNKSIYDGIIKYAVMGTVSEIIPIEKIHSAQIETVIDGEAAGDAGEDECRHRPQRVRHQRGQLHRKQQQGRGRGPHHRLLRDIGF